MLIPILLIIQKISSTILIHLFNDKIIYMSEFIYLFNSSIFLYILFINYLNIYLLWI